MGFEMRQEKDTAIEIIGYLDESLEQLDPDVAVKLADARNRAVSAFSARTAGSHDAGQSVVRLFNDYIYNHRALVSTAMVCSTAFIAFMVTQQFSGQELLEQSDAFLLGSELPPEAFLDKGFYAWLEHTSQH
jgi:hypothetical protein